ncbi:MAG TPA: amidohydrolase family protein [Nocardioidaceae bacterium]|jgi:predicted TIM-barrel fold metal-dependent hydrolase
MARTEDDAALAVLDGLHIIDCDSHLTEPPDLWTSRVPDSAKDRVPVQKTADGRTAWYLDGAPWASIGGNTIGTGLQKRLGTHMVQPFDDIDHSAWSVKERLALLDQIGVWAQILYPNGIGFSSNHVFAIEDETTRKLVLQTYNDFLVDTQLESNGRLFPQALLPVWDIDFTVQEIARLVDKGITGFTMSDKPELIGLPELPEPYFDPMWDILNDTGTVVNFHIGSGNRREETEAARASTSKAPGPLPPQRPGGPIPAAASPTWRSFGRQRGFAVLATQGYMSNVRIIVNLCMSNLFDRFDKLKIVSAESGIGWVPFVLEAMEFQLDEMVSEADEVSYQQRRPTEYFRDHLYVMFWFEHSAPEKLIADIGVNNVLIETDIPHPTCLYPDPMAHFARVLGHLPADMRRRVLQDNGSELYGIAVPAPAGT